MGRRLEAMLQAFPAGAAYPQGHNRDLAVMVLCLLGSACGPVSGSQFPPAGQGVVSDIPHQDGMCSTTLGPYGTCATSCCDAHDRCYVERGCSAASWVSGPENEGCHQCNLDLLRCWMRPCQDVGQEAVPSPGTQLCRSSRDCVGGQICEDFACQNEGHCYWPYSGPAGACCTLFSDCQSAVCDRGRCLAPLFSGGQAGFSEGADRGARPLGL